jgi:hypothetical protein|nr:hypothetical protein [Kofleriaceae bacterium]
MTRANLKEAEVSGRPKYIFCWWCSKQLWGKRFHWTMRETGANENASAVLVHRSCGEEMEREGGWEVSEKLRASG